MEQRSLSIVKLLTSESVDVPRLAALAGWQEGTDPQMLLKESGPHVSLVYVKNSIRKGQSVSFGIQKAELLNNGDRKRVLVQIKEKSFAPAEIAARVELVFNREGQGKKTGWVLVAIETDA